MSKTTYQNFLTVPGSTSDTISDGLTIGGDIVANFMAIADQIHPDGVGGLVVGGENRNLEEIYASSEYAHGAQGLHIINNNILGSASSDGLESTEYVDDGSGSYSVYVQGVGSGAFMKGLLLRYPSGYKTLINVPYAGAMIVHYDLIAFDGSNLSTKSGTIQIFATGLEGDHSTDFGEFSVSNGDLLFNPSNSWNALQIGLHGTILSGASCELNSWQSGNEYLNSGSSY